MSNSVDSPDGVVLCREGLHSGVVWVCCVATSDPRCFLPVTMYGTTQPPSWPSALLPQDAGTTLLLVTMWRGSVENKARKNEKACH